MIVKGTRDRTNTNDFLFHKTKKLDDEYGSYLSEERKKK